MITTLEKLPLRRIHFRVTFSNAAVEYSTASIVLSRERNAKRKTAYKTEGVMSHEKGRKPSATEGRTEKDGGTWFHPRKDALNLDNDVNTSVETREHSETRGLCLSDPPIDART